MTCRGKKNLLKLQSNFIINNEFRSSASINITNHGDINQQTKENKK